MWGMWIIDKKINTEKQKYVFLPQVSTLRQRKVEGEKGGREMKTSSKIINLYVNTQFGLKSRRKGVNIGTYNRGTQSLGLGRQRPITALTSSPSVKLQILGL